ncbi:MAG: hypothetical protein U1E76_17435 [Planctomycetota bacterium]
MFLLDANTWTPAALLGGAVASGILCARSRAPRALRPELAVQREFAGACARCVLARGRGCGAGLAAALLGARATGGAGCSRPVEATSRAWRCSVSTGAHGSPGSGRCSPQPRATSWSLYGPALAYESRLRKLLMVMLATVVFALSTGAALHALLTSVRVE